jgi:hypothetical protein
MRNGARVLLKSKKYREREYWRNARIWKSRYEADPV